jgi:hypothetical protein
MKASSICWDGDIFATVGSCSSSSHGAEFILPIANAIVHEGRGVVKRGSASNKKNYVCTRVDKFKDI